MYLIGAPHPHKTDAHATLERLIAAGQRLVADAEVLQEILHRYAAIDKTPFTKEFDYFLARNAMKSKHIPGGTPDSSVGIVRPHAIRSSDAAPHPNPIPQTPPHLRPTQTRFTNHTAPHPENAGTNRIRLGRPAQKHTSLQSKHNLLAAPPDTEK